MEKHEKIWVPVTQSPVPANSKTIGGTFYKPATNVIVLSVEEISDLWEAAKEYGSDLAAAVRAGDQSKVKTPGFFEYLQSKGIAL